MYVWRVSTYDWTSLNLTLGGGGTNLGIRNIGESKDRVS
jgi:hypothetical protein